MSISSGDINSKHVSMILNAYINLMKMGILDVEEFRYLRKPTTFELKITNDNGGDFYIIPTKSNQDYLEKFYYKLLEQNESERLEKRRQRRLNGESPLISKIPAVA